MPSASPETRALYEQLFGDMGDTVDGHVYLENRGYTITGGHIKPPPVVPPDLINCDICIDYLCDEWDYAYSGDNFDRT